MNYADTGTLTITKLLAEYASQQEGAVNVANKVTDASFTFNIYRSTSETVSTEGKPHTTATIAAGASSATVSAGCGR